MRSPGRCATRYTPLHGPPPLLIIVAILVGLGALTGAAPGHPSLVHPVHAPRDLAALDTQLAALRAVTLSGPDRPMSPKQAGAVLSAQFAAKVAALDDFERRTDPAPDLSARLRLSLLVRRAEALEDMHAALLSSWVPSYLTAVDQELYEWAVLEKAYPYLERAHEAASAASALAPQLTEADAFAEVLRARVLAHRSFRRLHPPRVPPTSAEREAADARKAEEAAREDTERAKRAALEQAMDASVRWLGAALDTAPACVPNQPRELAVMVLETWKTVVDERDLVMVADVLPFLQDSSADLRMAWACAPERPPDALTELDAALIRIAPNLPRREPSVCGYGRWSFEPKRPPSLVARTPGSPRSIPPPPTADLHAHAAFDAWLAAWRGALPTAAPRGLTGADIDTYDRHLEALTAAIADRDAATLLSGSEDGESGPLTLAALHLVGVEHRALVLALLGGDDVTPSAAHDGDWVRWALLDRRARLTVQMLRDLDAVDTLLDPLLALGRDRRSPTPDALAHALALQERSVALAERVFPVQH